MYEQAYEDYQQGMKYKDIATKYGVSVNTVKSWKTRYWNKKGVHTKDKKVCTQKNGRGSNPASHKNATGPPKNQNAKKHGFFSKWLPEETKELVGDINELDPLEVLWSNIQLQFAAIIRAQQVMYVFDKEDITKELKSSGEMSESYEIQYAWDKQAKFMNAQSRAMKTLESMLKQYDHMVNIQPLVTDEQRARIEVLRGRLQSQATEDNELAKLDELITAIGGLANE